LPPRTGTAAPARQSDSSATLPVGTRASGSATARAGWQPLPIVVHGPDGKPAAVTPAYAKSHSQGEYVFDHAWADA
jgi:predicted N-acyltransferase